MSMSRTYGRALVALALSTTTMLAAPAMAESDIVVSYSSNGKDVTQAKPVDISDLRLSTSRGRFAAEKRIVAAVKAVCSEGKAWGPSGESDYKRCFAESRSKALADAGLIRTASR